MKKTLNWLLDYYWYFMHIIEKTNFYKNIVSPFIFQLYKIFAPSKCFKGVDVSEGEDATCIMEGYEDSKGVWHVMTMKFIPHKTLVS